MKKSIVILSQFCVFAVQPLNAQIETGHTPLSFRVAASGTQVPTALMSSVDVSALFFEDSRMPPDEPIRFAEEVPANLNLENAGIWEDLSDGRLWRLRIESAGAYSVGLLYDDWFLPPGAELWVYNDLRDDVLGSLTERNNWQSGKNLTRHIRDDAVTLELFEPWDVAGQSRLSIFTICHAYRNWFGRPGAQSDFGSSGACNVNVNCPAGQGLWQSVKRGVVLVLRNNVRTCTGSMIRQLDFLEPDPFVLSANHCLTPDTTEYLWSFIFNYESPSCANVDGPTNQVVANATVRARDGASDFCLFELSDHVPCNYNVVLNGWNRTANRPNSTVCIHHPQGDIKKISFDNHQPADSGWQVPGTSHWLIRQWEVGTTEPGSSGAPLFNPSGHIIGQLHGGAADCPNPVRDYFGKFSFSWAGGGTPQSRLRDWLDPNNTGAFQVGHTPVSPPFEDVCDGIPLHNMVLPSTRSLRCAQDDYGNGCGSDTADVVYTYASPCSMRVTISLCGSLLNTSLDVRTGGPCPGNQFVICNDNHCGQQSQVTFDAAPLQKYYVIVSGTVDSTGIYTIDMTEQHLQGDPPIGDACPGIPVTSLPFTHMSSICSANSDFDNAPNTCKGQGDPDVVYHLQFTECMQVTISVCDTPFYEYNVEVRQGDTCPGDEVINCTSFICDEEDPPFEFLAHANASYYVLLSAPLHQATGPYTIMIDGSPATPNYANDQCPGMNIAALPFLDISEITCAVSDYSHSQGDGGPDLIYSYRAPCDMILTATVCEASEGIMLDILAAGDDDEPICPPDSLLDPTQLDTCPFMSGGVFPATSGHTYFFMVYAPPATAGSFSFALSGTSCAPDSVVVRRSGDDIHLAWPASIGAQSYYVYSDTTADFEVAPELLIGVTAGLEFLHEDVLMSAQSMMFYKVTSDAMPPP